MLIREQYLSKIRGFYHTKSLIKILYGMRRSGKSVILTQIIDELIKEGINKENIIYINFESLKYDFITNAHDLYNYIESLKINNKTYYVFLDEVQKVNDFEKAINSLRIDDNCSIFISGSNSRMTFLELSSELSGRYVKFRINPLSFKEVITFLDIKKCDYEKLLFDIFKWGNLPQRFLFESEVDKINYLSSVYDSIILKDVVERLKIKDLSSFNKVLQYILDIEGKEVSIDNLLKYLEKEHHQIANDTLYTYLEALSSTFIMNKVYRYDVHGKNTLKTLYKFYTNDLGIKLIKTDNSNINYSICLENIVYNELINKGYKVYVGKTRKGEIDFVTTKNETFKYIQVCYDLEEENTRKREFSAFDNIEGNEKYIITLSKKDYSTENVKQVNIFDFLLDDNF